MNILKSKAKGAQLLNAVFQQDYTEAEKKGYYYSPGTVPVLLMAHLDSVRSATEKYELCNGLYRSVGNGPAGFDDKCGIYCIVRTLQEALARPYVLITDGEEVGGTGATLFADTGFLKPGNIKLIIQFDRRGFREWVAYDRQPKEVRSLMDKHGFMECTGSFSDSIIIAEMLECAHVNLSCGFFNEHSARESCDLQVSEMAAAAAAAIINNKEYKDIPKVVSQSYCMLRHRRPMSALDWGIGGTVDADGACWDTSELDARRAAADELISKEYSALNRCNKCYTSPCIAGVLFDREAAIYDFEHSDCTDTDFIDLDTRLQELEYRAAECPMQPVLEKQDEK